MQEFGTDLCPQPVEDGTYVLASIVVPTTDFPRINIEDTGKFVGAVLVDTDAFNGEAIAASNEVSDVGRDCASPPQGVGQDRCLQADLYGRIPTFLSSNCS